MMCVSFAVTVPEEEEVAAVEDGAGPEELALVWCVLCDLT